MVEAVEGHLCEITEQEVEKALKGSDVKKNVFFAPCFFFVKKHVFFKLICLLKNIYYRVYLIM